MPDIRRVAVQGPTLYAELMNRRVVAFHAGRPKPRWVMSLPSSAALWYDPPHGVTEIMLDGIAGLTKAPRRAPVEV